MGGVISINLNMHWDNGEFSPLHNFFIQNFHIIGDLSILLIIVYYLESGFLSMVDAHDMGKLVANIEKGAKGALKYLGFMNQCSDENTIADSFVELDQHAKEAFNQEKQTTMVYNIIILEHGLCKYKYLPGINQPKHAILSALN